MIEKPAIMVLADDFTGAAEIAAIGVEQGLTTELASVVPVQVKASLLVIDTDTRPLSWEEASVRVSDMLAGLPRAGVVFKKTDSLLRGQVVAELQAVQRAVGLRACVLVPQNPSKGRRIAGGCYEIDGVPLEETSFRDDPEYPRWTADVVRLLTGSATSPDVQVHDVEDMSEEQEGIIVGNAESVEEVRRWAEVGNRAGALLAGGADLFRAFLEARGHGYTGHVPVKFATGKMLVVCGSAAAYSREMVDRWERQGLALCAMPALEESAACAAEWAGAVEAALHGSAGQAILVIRHALSPERAVAYRRCVAETVQQVVAEVRGDLTLAVEGGATAAAICEALGWREFAVEGNVSSGVVAVRPLGAESDGVRVTLILKPGSYPWPGAFLERCAAALR